MIMLKFPPVHKILEKDLSELEDEDPKNGVCILSGHAIVVSDQSIVCFGLHEYFTIKEKIQTEDQISELNEIMAFMENKMFSGAFWEELTKGAIVSIGDGKMHLEGAIKKDLIHDYGSFDSRDIKSILTKNINSPALGNTKSSFFVNTLMSVLTSLKPLIKNDSIVFESIGVNTNLRFTFHENPWIFGIIDQDIAYSGMNFIFENLASFCMDIKD